MTLADVPPGVWVTTAGVLLTAVLGLLGARAAGRNAKAAAARSAELDQIRLQITARDSQIAAWRADVETLRRERAEDAARCREQLAQLSTLIAVLRRTKDA